jgi:alkylation response protein AidB-like acyl-CoA dehydrogenase
MGIETWAATIDTVVIGAVEHDFMSLSRQTDDLLSATQQFAEAETGRCRSQRDARGAEEVSDWHSDWLKCGRQGLLGLRVPEQYEGQQKDVATTVAALEAFGRGCSDNGPVLRQ